MNPNNDGGAIPRLTLPRRLLLARLERNLSQREVSQLIGKTERTIGRYESGDTNIPLSVVLAYALALGIDREWLLNGSPDGGSIGHYLPMGVDISLLVPAIARNSSDREDSDAGRSKRLIPRVA
jgi:transcriptional regulator with XRE-family HTH domain